MENWVDAKAIAIADYRPQSFGQTEDQAIDGFLHRMDRLIEFSKLRAERAKPFVLADDRAATEPIVLESALETSRVVADLLHTLGQLAAAAPAEPRSRQDPFHGPCRPGETAGQDHAGGDWDGDAGRRRGELCLPQPA